MEEYLKKVAEQIRCRKALPYIEQELRDHLEDQIHENIAGGMDEKSAAEAAVKDMGDPVETGILLDRIHRPQIAWQLILIVAGISAAGLIIFSRWIAGCMTAACIVTLIFGMPVNGMTSRLSIGGITISMPVFLLLYVPVYGGILYQYYGKGYRGFLSVLIWMILPVILSFLMSSPGTALMLLSSMLVMLTLAVMKDWFRKTAA